MTLREELEALEYKRDDEINDGLAPWPALDDALLLCRRAVEAERELRDRYDARLLYLEAAQRDKERMSAELARLRAEVEDEGKRADLHADLNRRVFEVLGSRVTDPDALDTWHDLPERVSALLASEQRARELLAGEVSDRKIIYNAGLMDNYTDAARARNSQTRRWNTDVPAYLRSRPAEGAPCEECEGTGTIHRVVDCEALGCAPGSDAEPCPACNGTGKAQAQEASDG